MLVIGEVANLLEEALQEGPIGHQPRMRNLDDDLALERWDVHGSALDRIPISGGRHEIRLEYFEATGWSELKVRFSRR